MPYNPQISYTGDRALAAGAQQGAHHLFEALMHLSDSADQAKELRSQISTAYPELKDQVKDLSLSELRGTAMGLHVKDQQQGNALSNALKIAELAGQQRQQQSESAMSQAMAGMGNTAGAAGPGAGASDPRRQLADGSPDGTQQPANPGDLMRALAANPQAVNSPAGRQALQTWMRYNQLTQRGGPQFTTGPDGTSWAWNSSGQLQASPLEKIKAMAEAKAAAQPKPATAGAGPQLSRDGKFYWDTHLRTWKPLAANKDLFNQPAGNTPAAGAAAPEDVTYTWENGQLIRGGQ